MKKSSKCEVFFLIILFLLPLINFVQAASIPNYIGVQEEDEYVWLIDFDSVAYYKYFIATNDTAVPNYGEDLDAIKVKVSEINEEKSYTIYYQNQTLGSFDGVKYEFDYYETDDRDDDNAWKKKKNDSSSLILKYDSDIYWLPLLYGNIFIANNVDWDEIIDTMEVDIFSKTREIVTVEETSDNGYEIEFPATYERKCIEIISKYTSVGILESFKYYYDEDLIFSNELLDGNGEINYIFIGFIILLIVLFTATISALTIVLFLQKKKRTNSITSPIGTQITVGDQIQSPSPPIETPNVFIKQLFCPTCGQKSLNQDIFCSQCGTKLNEKR